MANLNSLSEWTSEIQELSPDAIKRTEVVANEAIAILDSNPDARIALQKTFQDMITGNLRDPANIASIQDWLYTAHEARLSSVKPMERLVELQRFSEFMAGFTENIAQMYRDVSLSNAAKKLWQESETKIAQVKSTYANIISSNHLDQTA